MNGLLADIAGIILDVVSLASIVYVLFNQRALGRNVLDVSTRMAVLEHDVEANTSRLDEWLEHDRNTIEKAMRPFSDRLDEALAFFRAQLRAVER